jgi:serine/threonine-protein kinase
MGVVHRDVKPSNLFLCSMPGGRIDVRICDFGAAKIFGGQQLTHAGAVVGTPLFIAPEQLRSSRDADARADVWSLGMTLYFALAGVAALESVRSFGQLVTILANGDIPHLQKTAPWVPPQLARVVHGTLIAKTDARCPSMKELAAALARCNAGDDAVAASALVPLHLSTRAMNYEPVPLPAHWHDVIVTMPTEPPPTLQADAPAGASVSAPASAPAPAPAPAPARASASASAPASASASKRWVLALALFFAFAVGAVAVARLFLATP